MPASVVVLCRNAKRRLIKKIDYVAASDEARDALCRYNVS